MGMKVIFDVYRRLRRMLAVVMRTYWTSLFSLKWSHCRKPYSTSSERKRGRKREREREREEERKGGRERERERKRERERERSICLRTNSTSLVCDGISQHSFE
jgi:hypothetical protein